MVRNRKRKGKAPKSLHHPSQSSVDVPRALKAQIKDQQDGRCWLCDKKAHKRTRPLEICHIYPQALKIRHRFQNHHRNSRTLLGNIHAKENLIALCDLCHNAFDNSEWTFVPKEGSTWLAQMTNEPENNLIHELNQRRDLVYSRILLQADPDSPALQDESYTSAFEKEPDKNWPGEVGSLMIRPNELNTMPLDPSQTKATEARTTFLELVRLWVNYSSPCSKQDCRLCNHQEDDSRSDEGNGGEEEDEGDDGENDEWNSEDGEEKDRITIQDQGPAKRRKSLRLQELQLQQRSEGTSSALQAKHTRHYLAQARHRPRSNLSKRRPSPYSIKYSSIPYDKSVPYSHRVGYTWADSCSNDIAQWWQATYGVS